MNLPSLAARPKPGRIALQFSRRRFFWNRECNVKVARHGCQSVGAASGRSAELQLHRVDDLGLIEAAVTEALQYLAAAARAHLIGGRAHAGQDRRSVLPELESV